MYIKLKYLYTSLAIALAIIFGLNTQSYAQHHGGHHSAPHGHGFGGHHPPGHFGSSHNPFHHGGHGHGNFSHGNHGHGFGGHHSPGHFGSSHNPFHHGGHGHDDFSHGNHGHGFDGHHSPGHFGSFWHNPFLHGGHDNFGHGYGHGFGGYHSPGYFGNFLHSPFYHDGHGFHGSDFGGHGFGGGFLSFLPQLFDLRHRGLGSDRYPDSRYYEPRVYEPDSPYLNSEDYRPRLSYTDSMRAGSDYFRNGDYRRASQSFLEAILLRPNEPVPKFSLGHSLFALGDYNGAAYAIRRGLTIFPDWVKIRMDRRRFYNHSEEFDSQLIALEHWSERHPNNASAKFLLGYNYYFSDQKEKAYYAFRDVLVLNPDDRYSRYFLNEIDKLN